MQLFGLKNCDTCRKALRSLTESGHQPVLVDVKKSPLERSQLEQFLQRLGPQLLNRRSTTWRNLDDSQKSRDPVDLLAQNPSLMKRPVIIAGGDIYLGWSTDVQTALLVNS